jgi:cell division septal protein FtsQ
VTAVALRRVSPRRLAVLAVRRLSPRLKRRLLALAVASLVLAAGYQLWFRDSSLVEVKRVQVTGLTTSDAKRVRAALTSAGKTMTTLHVDRAALDRAVETYPVIRALEVSPDFPHALRIRVIEYQPAAIAVSGGSRVPVAGDGTILRGVAIEGHLPTVEANGGLGTKSLEDPTARGAAAVAGAAPALLRSRIDDVEHTGEGFVANLSDGPELIFGRATQLRAKWAAAARILADLEARGASYLDLRLPGRPAVGGLAAETVAPVAPAGTIGMTPTTPTTPTPTATTTAPGTSTPSTATDPAATAPTQPTQTPAQGTAPTAETPTPPVTAGAGGGAATAP